MENHNVYPEIGAILRAVVTNAGYRPLVDKHGLGSDIDNINSERQQSSVTELLTDIEAFVLSKFEDNAGASWRRLLEVHWTETRKALQVLSRDVPLCLFATPQGREEIRTHFDRPLLVQTLYILDSQIPGPDWRAWWRSPFAAWMEFACRKLQLKRETLRDHLLVSLDVDPRTLERWENGESAIKKGTIYGKENTAPLISAAPPGSFDLEEVIGWLVVSIAYQAIPLEMREKLQRTVYDGAWKYWTPDSAAVSLSDAARDLVSSSDYQPMWSFLSGFSNEPNLVKSDSSRLLDEIEKQRDNFPVDRDEARYLFEISAMYIEASVAAHKGDQENALKLYREAVKQAWWLGGPSQESLLKEALIYAVGVGHKVDSKRYWDRLSLLGINEYEKKPLDGLEIRRISRAFENQFSPQRAECKFLPSVEVVDEIQEVNKADFKSPNALQKTAEGKIRRTPLMRAVISGRIGEVEKIFELGRDVNIDRYVSENGETALSLALRGGVQTQDFAIAEYLLSKEPSRETLNRESSGSRETPLKLAVESGSAAIVGKLIAKGADVEESGGSNPFPLLYALMKLEDAINGPDSPYRMEELVSGASPSAFEAGFGAITNGDVENLRKRFAEDAFSDDREKRIFYGVLAANRLSPSSARQVIATLVANGANPNRSYHDRNNPSQVWTPTLYAAQIGDVEAFDILLSSGGDPNRVINPSESASVYCDALWLAMRFGNAQLVEYLKDGTVH